MTKYINLHTHCYSKDDTVLEVLNQYPWEFDEAFPQYSVGIHPWYAKVERLEEDLVFIKYKFQEEKCLALGECGLDKRIEIPLKFQIEVFQRQLELVQSNNKPIILHCVAAFDEIISIKKEMNIKNPMIIHGFSKNNQVAKTLLNQGFYISFGKYLFRNPDLKEVFTFVPNDLFFLETDTIEETIFEVYEKAASYKELKLEEMKEIVNVNFNKVFNF